jgi:hypothetical protein
MANLRNVMLVAVLAATAIASIAAFLLLGGAPSRLLVDAGLAAALGVIVWVTLSPTIARVDMLVEALRALARGDKHQRVNPDDFAGLADVARALNEVAASMTEGEDPNLGPVRAQPRPGRPPRRENVDDPLLSDHPELGPVRVMKKSEGEKSDKVEKPEKSERPASERPVRAVSDKDEPAPPVTRPATSLSGSEAVGEPRPMRRRDDESAPNSKPNGKPESSPPSDAARDAAARPESKAPGNDTAVDENPRAAASDVRSVEPEIAKIPSRAELEALFQEFVARKKSKDESVVDLDLDAFAQTIQGECERLIAAHHCKGVRFEVAEVDGEVSLRPRLLR